MSTPEALRLADALGQPWKIGGYITESDMTHAAAELRRQHAEIERLTAERDALKLTTERLQQHNVTTWNAGHTLGLMAGQKALTQAQDALQRDAWGNTQLTEALLAAEAERDALRAVLKDVGVFLHHCWCDVQMNDHSFERLNAAMDAVDGVLKPAKPKEPSNV